MGSSASRPSSRAPSRSGSTSHIQSPKTQASSHKKEKESKNKQSRDEESSIRDEPSSTEKEEDEAKDIMISYSHADKEIMRKVRSVLEEHGFSVWVDVSGLTAGVNFLTKIGQAVIDCKAFISLLSEKTIKSRCCQDELALAYVSQKPIFPIGIQTPQELLPLMDTGMRLQLARFDWFLLTNPASFEDNMQSFVEDLRQHFHERGLCHTCSHGDTTSKRNGSVPKLTRTKTSGNLKKGEPQKSADDLWEHSFKESTAVEWSKFESAFNDVSSDILKENFGVTNTAWVVDILRRELEVRQNEGKVTKENYIAFCTLDGKVCPFLSRVEDHVIESYCMKEVFDMESSVRVEAIENLGRFRSKAVIEALLDLLDDCDSNVRTVAAISLAKTGDNSLKVIHKLMSCLDSDDRLVRESGSLALGHLKAKEAVPKLVHLWRNDFISSVRDACQLALEQIGGEEANKAIHITNVLANEIRSLTKD